MICRIFYDRGKDPVVNTKRDVFHTVFSSLNPMPAAANASWRLNSNTSLSVISKVSLKGTLQNYLPCGFSGG